MDKRTETRPINTKKGLELRKRGYEQAIEVFKELKRKNRGANVYDSVAEAYEANGHRDLAIVNYKRSLELDPKNTNAAQQLKRLGQP